MSDSFVPSIEIDAAFAGRFAIVGLGETDYAADYAAVRARGPGDVPPDAESLGTTAFERALLDSGLDRTDIDGICVSFPYGGSSPEVFAKAVGVTPRELVKARGMMPFLAAVDALASGSCNTIAIVHSLPSRSIGRQYGGQTYGGGGRDSYYYYHPWGWSSQAAHWALMFGAYQTAYGATEEDLGRVAVTLRTNAMRNDNAIMRAPLSLDEYLASRYIVRPMHLFDMCLVNDGAVCVIVTATDRAKDLAHTPVVVSGWGNEHVHDSKMHYMVKERLYPQMQRAASAALAMAGLDIGDIDHFEGYDASSIHLVNQLEGYGFVGPGEGLAFWTDGHTELGGTIPTNTGGGMLSESYLQAWNLMAEVVRQLRHEAGARQVADARASLHSFATTDSAHPIVFTRGA